MSYILGATGSYKKFLPEVHTVLLGIGSFESLIEPTLSDSFVSGTSYSPQSGVSSLGSAEVFGASCLFLL